MPVEDKIKKELILAPLTTFGIGGPAEFFLEIREKEELVDGLAWARKSRKEVSILGGGSNLLVSDGGARGLVLKISGEKVLIKGDRIECEAGAELAKVFRLAKSGKLSGLEWSAGIPRATVGGAIRGNAGAFGFSMENITETVEAFNLKKERFFLFSNKDCQFGYRESVFKKEKDLIIWQAGLKMKPNSEREIYQATENYLKKRLAGQPKLPSAGSIFKNLTQAEIQAANPALSALAEEEQQIKNGKIGAGWVIDKLGFKGRTVGGAKVSLEHANFIVNTGRARAEEVVTLIELIKREAKLRFGLELKEEIQYFGF